MQKQIFNNFNMFFKSIANTSETVFCAEGRICIRGNRISSPPHPQHILRAQAVFQHFTCHLMPQEPTRMPQKG